MEWLHSSGMRLEWTGECLSAPVNQENLPSDLVRGQIVTLTDPHGRLVKVKIRNVASVYGGTCRLYFQRV